ncbi:MAG: nucleotidyltransferase family protein [Anaerolineales bacterium]|nr:nucleotidyltransferase family protein [Anaerolineales bacterium]
MDAIVTAGGIPVEGEPLYEFTQGRPKALLDIGGKPMIQWVLDALDSAETIDRVVVIGLTEESGLTGEKVKAYIPDRGEMIDNIRAGVEKVIELNPQAGHVLAASSDIPGITPEIVNWVVNTSMQTDEDLYYCVVPRSAMEGRFPNSRRSYVHLKDIEACGGDMNIIRTSLVQGDDSFWRKLVATRKNALKQAALIGYGTLILLLFRMITMDQAVKRVTRRLNLTGRAVVCPYAEVAMDVDKPHQLEIMRQDLAGSTH